MVKLTRSGARRLSVLAAMAAVAAGALTASQALAAVPHSATGVITGCYDSSGALRVVDAQQGQTCAPGDAQVTWNATTISASHWGSGVVRPLNRAGGVDQVVLRQPTAALPAGSWMATAAVMIANSEAVESFSCWLESRGSLAIGGAQVQEWGGSFGWHHTMTIPGMFTFAQPDWVDVHCSHARTMSNVGFVQVETVDVFVQRVATTF